MSSIPLTLGFSVRWAFVKRLEGDKWWIQRFFQRSPHSAFNVLPADCHCHRCHCDATLYSGGFADAVLPNCLPIFKWLRLNLFCDSARAGGCHTSGGRLCETVRCSAGGAKCWFNFCLGPALTLLASERRNLISGASALDLSLRGYGKIQQIR